MNENDDVLEIVKTGVLGFITGDAFGVPVEFTQRRKRKEELLTEMIGYGTYQVPEGTWSDDTSMTIASFDSIRECGNINYQDIMNKYCQWVKQAMYTATNRVFDVGGTTAHAIYNYCEYNLSPTECGGRNEMNNGNGSLMRMLPIVYYLHYSDLDDETKIDIIKNYSSLTHGNEVSILGCTIYNDYMHNLLNGYNKKDSYLGLDIDKYRMYFSEDSIERYRRILKHELDYVDEDGISSSGYVVDTLEACIWTTLNTGSYEEAIVEAVSLGEDTDTIGAITGSMAATIYGEKSIPNEWLSKVREKDYVLNIVTGYCDVLNDQRRNNISL